jgi:DNA processing protein
LRGIGKQNTLRILQLLKMKPNQLDDLEEVVNSFVPDVPLLSSITRTDIENANSKVLAIRIALSELHANAISYSNQRFPSRLRLIPDPPALLFLRGNEDLLSSPRSVAIVGTREPTPYAFKAGERITQLFVERHFTIVSGLALGCDAIAHTSCLKYGGSTIAVLPSGLDSVYPRTHRGLADEIIEKQGLLVTEYPPGATIFKNYFVDRDRLQSGLSDAVIVLETDIEGGTMHTVKFAHKQNRIVACLASHPLEYTNYPKTQGNKKLIRENLASPLRDKQDIERLLFQLSGRSADQTGGGSEEGTLSNLIQENLQNSEAIIPKKKRRARRKQSSGNNYELPF